MLNVPLLKLKYDNGAILVYPCEKILFDIFADLDSVNTITQMNGVPFLLIVSSKWFFFQHNSNVNMSILIAKLIRVISVFSF